ncbi:MAG TPA: VOC family protein, partial [Anaerolineae bacterium]
MRLAAVFLFEQMCKPRLSHIQIKVRNLDESIEFYKRYLGMNLIERIGDQYAFLSTDDRHHQLALQCAGRQAPRAPSNSTGLYLVAFEIPDKASFVSAYKLLTSAGIETVLVDHLISWAINFSDPDGNGLEISWDTRSEPGGQPFWRGR